MAFRIKPLAQWSWFSLIFWGIVLILGAGILREVFIAIRCLPNAQDIEAPIRLQSTRAYTADGALIARFHAGENREEITLDQVSTHVIHALIATEDKRFYEHAGVDAKALPLAFLRNILHNRTTGASTITMQLARNLYPEVGREKNIRRKLREMLTSIWLERHYTKDEILLAYLNTVNIYGNCYGIETASKRLFAKSASELDPGESAFLVGLLKGQGRYNPRTKPAAAQQRRNVVLRLMFEQQLIDSTQRASFAAQPISLAAESADSAPALAPYFRERLRIWLEAWADTAGYDLYRDGLTVVTTLDSGMQQHAEAAMRSWLSEIQPIFYKHIVNQEAWQDQPHILTRQMRQSGRHWLAKQQGLSEDSIRSLFQEPVPMRVFSWDGPQDTILSPMDSIRYYSRFLEAGLCAMDPHTGYVRAWVGGIEHDFFKFDHVELGKRQTGSSFKPFVYATALESGYLPCTPILNQRLDGDYGSTSGGWAPENVDKSIGGFVTLRRALAKSVNLVSARLIYKVGPKQVVDHAHRMGISSHIDPYPAICLGVTDLSVLEMTHGYATYANRGVKQAQHIVKEIRDRDGKRIYEAPLQGKLVLDPEVAYTMVDLLRGSMGRISGIKGKIQDTEKTKIDIGGKTGTTQNNSDGWFMGISPSLVAGVWVGCNDRQMRFRDTRLGQGAYLAKPIWTRFMQRVYADSTMMLSDTKFQAPEGFKIPLRCNTPQARPQTQTPRSKTRGVLGWD